MFGEMAPGPRNLITDVAGLRLGNAEDGAARSGVTVLAGDAPFTCSYAVHGGAPGTRETDLLEPDKTVPGVDALVLSGGSAFGLAAAQGVMEALHAQGRGFQALSARVPLVPAAIIFDLLNGGQKDWSTNPYPALGAQALGAAGRDFVLGASGAGFGALTAGYKGGLGSASLVLEDGTTVGAVMVANPLGDAITPGGQHFWAAPFEVNNEFGGLGIDPAPGLRALPPSRKLAAMQTLANTTIGIVATDASLTKAQCKQLATAAHDGIARAVVPAHGPGDGDLIFAASTAARTAPVDHGALSHAAAVCVSRAIARAVWEARHIKGDVLPAFRSERSDHA